MAAVRHLGIVLPPYDTTHEVTVARRSCMPFKFHVNIVLPPYDTTHEVTVARRSCMPFKFHVNVIHSSEDIAI